MESSALGSATSLLGKVLSKLSQGVVAAYVDSLELGHNSVQIKAKLLHTKGLLEVAQGRDMSSVSALKEMLEELSRQADKAEDLLDEIHYFKIHDRLHGTSYATTQGEGGTILHARSALRHTVGSLLSCFSCSRAQDGADDSALAGATADGGAANSAAAADDGDEPRFDRVSVSEI